MDSLFAGRIVGVVGWKDAGKTPVVERLVAYLTSRGYTVGTVKHVHEGATLQPEAADSVRHLEAGAVTTVALGGDTTVVLTRQDCNLDEAMARHLALCDYVVVEGFKRAPIPKVIVLSGDEAVPPDLDGVIAVVGTGRVPQDRPAFTFDEIDKLGKFLFEEQVLRDPVGQTTLFVDGRFVPLNEFVQSSLAGVIRGYISSLKAVDTPPTTIHLHLKGDRPLFPV
jgi:molybdopterin-guanine dinucleotide biosynthesis protein B